MGKKFLLFEEKGRWVRSAEGAGLRLRTDRLRKATMLSATSWGLIMDDDDDVGKKVACDDS